MDLLHDFISFLSKCPTAFHAADTIEKRLIERGFQHYKETESWKDYKKHRKGYTKRGAAVVAWTAPSSIRQILIHATHLDSPSLKIKPACELAKDGGVMLPLDVYGSPNIHSYFDRDLVISGAVFHGSPIKKTLIHLDAFPISIPSLPMHIQKSRAQEFSKQHHLQAVVGIDPANSSVKRIIEKMVGNEILSHELYVVPKDLPSVVGLDHSAISAYRLDNLSSVYPALVALENGAPAENTLVLSFFFNHEEIGSGSDEGALGSLFSDILSRIQEIFTLSSDEYISIKRRSLALSIDVGHALHPNFSQEYEPQHAPKIGKGITLKHSPLGKYATRGSSAAYVELITKQLKTPLQQFISHADHPGGSTVGSMIEREGISTVDIGIPILAMHGAKELMAISDLHALYTLLHTSIQRGTDVYEPF